MAACVGGAKWPLVLEVPSSGLCMTCQVLARLGGAKGRLMYGVRSGGSCMRCQVGAHG